MLCTQKYRVGVAGGISIVVSLVLILVLSGCGGESDKGVTVGSRPNPDYNGNVVARTPRGVETVPVSGEQAVIERAVAIQEPALPVVVTYEEAEAAYNDRRYNDATELFTHYTERKSENPWGFYMLGLSAWKAGDLETAKKAFDRALELDPDHVKAWLNLGRVYLDMGKPEDALTKIDEAMVLDRESNVAFRLQGRVFHQLGRWEDAIDSYYQAIAIDDQDAWAMNNLGLILIEKELFDEALRPLARAVVLRDDIAIFQNNLGMVLEWMGHFREAEDAYRAAVAIDSSYEKAEVNLARIEIITEESYREPIDIEALAMDFGIEIEGWREAFAYEEQCGGHEQETIALSETDSTGNAIEQ
jgi:Tfp pilus assembly protein PilF